MGGMHCQPQLGNNVFENVPGDGVIVHHQHRARCLFLQLGRQCGNVGTPILNFSFKLRREMEGTTGAQGAVDPDPSLHHFDQML